LILKFLILGSKKLQFSQIRHLLRKAKAEAKAKPACGRQGRDAEELTLFEVHYYKSSYLEAT
jgi:hypothetical protein